MGLNVALSVASSITAQQSAIILVSGKKSAQQRGKTSPGSRLIASLVPSVAPTLRKTKDVTGYSALSAKSIFAGSVLRSGATITVRRWEEVGDVLIMKKQKQREMKVNLAK